MATSSFVSVFNSSIQKEKSERFPCCSAKACKRNQERSFQKCPFSGGKVPFVFVKNVVQIAFLPQWPLINANTFPTFP
jgi:hypothetical protein